MRLYPRFGSLGLGSLSMVLGCALAAQPAWAGGPLGLLRGLSHAFLLHNSPGYLGVDVRDVRADRATTLKLKEGQGVEVVAVDHDAPAATAGLRIHDVILRMNGDPIKGCDQLRHMLRKQPPGRTVTFLVSRGGGTMNLSVQLADRVALEHQAWSRHYSVPEPAEPSQPSEQPEPSQNGAEQSFIGSSPQGGSHFMGALIPKPFYVGVDVNPVHTQLADYFGVTSGTGLLVENVDSSSPASRAGLRAGDVILRVNATPMVTRGDWLKAIRNNRGKLVQLTIMRNKREQTLTMPAGMLKKPG